MSFFSKYSRKVKKWYKKQGYKEKINSMLIENSDIIRVEVKRICTEDLGYNESKAEAYASVFVAIAKKVIDKVF